MADTWVAKLSVSVENTGIAYNRNDELKTEVFRGQELENGHVVRGLGTAYVSKEAEARHKYLKQLEQQIRLAFSMRFLRALLDGSFFTIPAEGAGKKWLDETELEFVTGTKKGGTYRKETMKVNSIPGLEVRVSEYFFGQRETADEKSKREWGERVADQLSRFPLGRGKELKEDSLKALEAIIDSPFITKETQDELLRMVGQLRVGTIDKQNFTRNIKMMDIKMDDAPLIAPRRIPTPPATPSGV